MCAALRRAIVWQMRTQIGMIVVSRFDKVNGIVRGVRKDEGIEIIRVEWMNEDGNKFGECDENLIVQLGNVLTAPK